jgi:CpeS-like protein
MTAQESFQQFFDCCVGSWVTERTYHYLSQPYETQDVERSHTEFNIHPLAAELKIKVLTDNQYDVPATLDAFPGYHLAFETVSDKGEHVSHSLNMLFVPQKQDAEIVIGDYLRDRAYEEAKPMIAQFQFNLEHQELLMTTTYTRVVSIDTITLVNPNLRIRKILNYHRPPTGEALKTIALAGFGVEQKRVP